MSDNKEVGAISLDMWMDSESKNSGVTTEQLDKEIRLYKELEKDYEAKKKISSEAYRLMEDQQTKVMELMKLAGKTKYNVEGLGTAYFINKLLVPTPKTIENKKQLFEYIKARHGDIFLMDKLSIHSATLNKLYNDEFNEYKETSQDAIFNIPGLDAPTAHQSLGFRKDK
jgi:uncharacterized protein YhaN